MQVRAPRRDDVHHDDGNTLLKVRGALGGEGVPVARPVLVGRADEFHGRHQSAVPFVVDDLGSSTERTAVWALKLAR